MENAKCEENILFYLFYTNNLIGVHRESSSTPPTQTLSSFVVSVITCFASSLTITRSSDKLLWPSGSSCCWRSLIIWGTCCSIKYRRSLVVCSRLLPRPYHLVRSGEAPPFKALMYPRHILRPPLRRKFRVWVLPNHIVTVLVESLGWPARMQEETEAPARWRVLLQVSYLAQPPEDRPHSLLHPLSLEVPARCQAEGKISSRADLIVCCRKVLWTFPSGWQTTSLTSTLCSKYVCVDKIRAAASGESDAFEGWVDIFLRSKFVMIFLFCRRIWQRSGLHTLPVFKSTANRLTLSSHPFPLYLSQQHTVHSLLCHSLIN